MPALRKSLDEFVRDRSFLARRHCGLLESEPLVGDPRLRQLQERYCAETSELERRQLALEFEKAVRADPPEGAGPPRKSIEELRAELDAILHGPPTVPDVRDLDVAREMRRVMVRDQYVSGLYRKTGDEPIRQGTLAEIAASVGVSPSTARRYLRELGVERRPPLRRSLRVADRLPLVRAERPPDDRRE